jgi:hypothetical protein
MQQMFAKGEDVPVACADTLVTDTGMEFSFQVPGSGVVFAQAGNFTFLPDGTVISHGLDRFSPELCQVLAP